MSTVKITVFWKDIEGTFDSRLRAIIREDDFYAESDDFENGEEVEVREKSFVFREKEFAFLSREPNQTEKDGDDLEMEVDDVVAFLRLALTTEDFAIIDFTEGGLIWSVIEND